MDKLFQYITIKDIHEVSFTIKEEMTDFFKTYLKRTFPRNYSTISKNDEEAELNRINDFFSYIANNWVQKLFFNGYELQDKTYFIETYEGYHFFLFNENQPNIVTLDQTLNEFVYEMENLFISIPEKRLFKFFPELEHDKIKRAKEEKRFVYREELLIEAKKDFSFFKSEVGEKDKFASLYFQPFIKKIEQVKLKNDVVGVKMTNGDNFIIYKENGELSTHLEYISTYYIKNVMITQKNNPAFLSKLLEPLYKDPLTRIRAITLFGGYTNSKVD